MNILTVLNKAKALELADFLDNLSVNGPSYFKDDGICNNVYFFTYRVRKSHLSPWLDEVFKLWPKHSGHQQYPIPHKKGAEDAYYTLRKWNKRTQYGKDRRELCAFLANLIRSQCDE